MLAPVVNISEYNIDPMQNWWLPDFLGHYLLIYTNFTPSALWGLELTITINPRLHENVSARVAALRGNIFSYVQVNVLRKPLMT